MRSAALALVLALVPSCRSTSVTQTARLMLGTAEVLAAVEHETRRGPIDTPTTACMPVDVYIAGASYLVTPTITGCEWMAWDEHGTLIARGVVPRRHRRGVR
jgi:hypothetical protein